MTIVLTTALAVASLLLAAHLAAGRQGRVLAPVRARIGRNPNRNRNHIPEG